jgi:Major Facilitator Superfamily
MQNLAGAYGWAGWQWLFLLEGLPSVLLGLCVLAYLADDIAGATWLTASEKRVLVEAIARDAGKKQEGSIVKALLDPRVWLTGAIYFCFVAGLYGVGFWLPTIISGMGVKSLTGDEEFAFIPLFYARMLVAIHQAAYVGAT